MLVGWHTVDAVDQPSRAGESDSYGNNEIPMANSVSSD